MAELKIGKLDLNQKVELNKLFGSKNKKAAAATVPVKDSVNLVMKEDHGNLLLTLAIGIPVIILLALAVAKFGIIDQQARLETAREEYETVHAQNEELKEYLTGYDELQREYALVTGGRNAEQGATRLLEVLDMVEQEMRTKGDLESLELEGERMVCTMSGMTLKEVSAMLEKLEEYPLVESAGLVSAETYEEQGTGELESVSVVVWLQAEQEEEAEEE